MKGRGILLCGLLVACWSSAVPAQEAWLMVHGTGNRTVVRAAGKTLVTIAELGATSPCSPVEYLSGAGQRDLLRRSEYGNH
jgi:hypothetical protein